MVKNLRIILGLIFLFSFSTFSQNIIVKASTDKTDYLVGDYIYYSIQVDHDKNLKVYTPDINDSLSSIAVIKKENPVDQVKENKITTTFNYILSGYDSVQVTLPPVRVAYNAPGDTAMHYAAANTVTILIKTLKIDTTLGIKDVKEPIKIPLDWRWIALLVLIALIIIGLIYYFYLRYQKKKSAAKPVKKVIILPPYMVALNALNDLEDQKLWQKGQIKEYHSIITEIIRKYFEERFNMPALELPTSEAVDLLRQREGTGQILDTTYNFLSNADLVKFAKFIPLGSVNEEMMKQALEIVDKTKNEFAEVNKEEAGNVR
jgi:hypothetical protein